MAGGSASRPPSMMHFSYTSLLTHVSQFAEVESSRTRFDVLGLEGRSKVKAVASKPQLLKNCPVLGLRRALFFELLKFCEAPEKFFWKTVSSGNRLTIFLKIFFLESSCACALILGLGLEHSCPWSREGLSLALAWDFFLCPWPVFVSFFLFFCVLFFVSLASSLVSSTPPLPIWTFFFLIFG